MEPLIALDGVRKSYNIGRPNEQEVLHGVSLQVGAGEFMALMGPKRGPAFWKSMALWNDAMAESVASFRAAHPQHRVLLTVGQFHVAARLGTITAYLERRPSDRVAVATMIAGASAFAEDDRDEGDLVIKVP